MGQQRHRQQHGHERAAQGPEALRPLARLQDHVTMLSEAEGAPIGRALTNEEQQRLLETAASDPEWEHVYCAAVLAANTSMRGVEVKHVRRKDVDLEKVWDVESATGKGVLYYVRYSKNETSKRKIPLNGAARDAITRMLKLSARTNSGTRRRSIISGAPASISTTTRPSRRRSGTAPGGRYGTEPASPASGSTTYATRSSPICSRPVSPSTLSRP